MRVFVAGAGGAIGRRLLPQLVERGHEVVATTRNPAKGASLRALGAEPLVMDGLDAGSVGEAVARAEPEVIVHQMTALTGVGDLKRFDAAVRAHERASDARARASAGCRGGRRRPPLRRPELHRLAERPRGRACEVGAGSARSEPAGRASATRSRRSATSSARSSSRTARRVCALRYGRLYGPGTSMAQEYAELIRKRKLPVVGDGAGVWSFVHVDDAAAATVAAVERGGRGVYNVVDDDPAPVSEWLPYLAECLGAQPPRHVPVWLARLRDRRGRRLDDDADPRLVEREGQGGARLGATLDELARGLPARARRFGGRAAGCARTAPPGLTASARRERERGARTICVQRWRSLGQCAIRRGT